MPRFATDTRTHILFTVESPGTAVLPAAGMESDRLRAWYTDKPPGAGQPGGSAWPGDPGRLWDSGGAEYWGRDSSRSRAARASQQ